MNQALLKTLIVDDEPIARARLRALCGEMSETVEVIGEAENGAQALGRIAEGEPDLLLLDIAMPDLDGLMVAAALARMATAPAIIFCTAHPGHALAAFEVAAVDYLLKPVNRDRLARGIEKAARLRRREQGPQHASRWLDQLWLPHRDAMRRVDIRDVERLEAEGDYVRVCTAQTSYLLHDTLTRLESRLDPDMFVRVRRSMIVRSDLLRTADHLGGGVWEVTLADGKVVRVGPTYWKALKSRFKSN